MELFGIGAFIAIVVASVCSFQARYRKNLKGQKPSTCSLTSKYNNALLELQYPSKSYGCISRIRLLNDIYIACAVRDVGEKIFVNIISNSDELEINVLQYLSEIYSRLWDEISQCQKFTLNCIVVGSELKNSQMISRNQLFMLPDIEAVYSASINGVNELMQMRVDAKLPLIKIEDFGMSHLPFDENNILYFDGEDQTLPSFHKVALGGTFDFLHNGHKKLLTLAAAVCQKVLIIGVMSDALLKNKSSADLINPTEIRLEAVKEFVSFIKPSLELQLPVLHDPFGPTIHDNTIDAIVVSSETIAGASKINEIRKSKGMNPLKILVMRRSDTALLSSTFIREQKRLTKN